MKAAILREVNKPLTIEEVSLDAPGPGVLLCVPFCGSCRDCMVGRPYLCTQGRTRQSVLHIGDHAAVPFASMSSFAEYMVVPEGGVVKIRKDVPLDRGGVGGCGGTTAGG